jgi:hypothetical protein
VQQQAQSRNRILWQSSSELTGMKGSSHPKYCEFVGRLLSQQRDVLKRFLPMKLQKLTQVKSRYFAAAFI